MSTRPPAQQHHAATDHHRSHRHGQAPPNRCVCCKCSSRPPIRSMIAGPDRAVLCSAGNLQRAASSSRGTWPRPARPPRNLPLYQQRRVQVQAQVLVQVLLLHLHHAAQRRPRPGNRSRHQRPPHRAPLRLHPHRPARPQPQHRPHRPETAMVPVRRRLLHHRRHRHDRFLPLLRPSAPSPTTAPICLAPSAAARSDPMLRQLRRPNSNGSQLDLPSTAARPSTNGPWRMLPPTRLCRLPCEDARSGGRRAPGPMPLGTPASWTRGERPRPRQRQRHRLEHRRMLLLRHRHRNRATCRRSRKQRRLRDHLPAMDWMRLRHRHRHRHLLLQRLSRPARYVQLRRRRCHLAQQLLHHHHHRLSLLHQGPRRPQHDPQLARALLLQRETHHHRDPRLEPRTAQLLAAPRPPVAIPRR
ncbi:hypothetical protein AMAG_20781 [Allomyces macrogynus ATCC 38327]|uniref:Uncharacterized protein n=1 Tax=Allomyces macrogynus (strain ATCC 38327) TaxID=578462 RepID=A0A0L0TEW8_ALLM3|nr:hypothetical protein AMAG_20781 [Allomyces macrogynus ATCC 38327]|eukprot:KNE73393.1 hypothetical protein AMAG_20781 [Allomyces macrogynus ATCC 38327]